ncbi:hypothetical protein [Methylobacterium tarhaniae]|uniref:hypothetical protein n=1 Tax=Methylobacterium tarhaniae TaxID=1187852 RepID=UPI000A8DCA4B|nr:hypothetical protein [Methylobacterium tarhaniae]
MWWTTRSYTTSWDTIVNSITEDRAFESIDAAASWAAQKGGGTPRVQVDPLLIL